MYLKYLTDTNKLVSLLPSHHRFYLIVLAPGGKLRHGEIKMFQNQLLLSGTYEASGFKDFVCLQF